MSRSQEASRISGAHWGTYDSTGELPNVAGATGQSRHLNLGDVASVLGTLYECTDASEGAATWAAVDSSGDGTTTLIAAEATPSTPAAGNLRIFGKDNVGRAQPQWIGPDGTVIPFASAIYARQVQWMFPRTGGSFTFDGLTAPGATGTITTPTLAVGSLRLSTHRSLVTSAATADSVSEIRVASNQCYRGELPGLGGFFAAFRFGINSSTANQRVAVGFFNTGSALSTTLDPDDATQCVFVGWDSADTTLQMFHNDGAGSATRVDLGASFPANNTDAIYELLLGCLPNGSTIDYRVTRVDSFATTTGSLSTDLPDDDEFLNMHYYVNNGGTAAEVPLEFYKFYLESST